MYLGDTQTPPAPLDCPKDRVPFYSAAEQKWTCIANLDQVNIKTKQVAFGDLALLAGAGVLFYLLLKKPFGRY